MHPELAKFQGPALLAYNDAEFKEEDWEGIQNFKLSGKRKDPFKVGKFGIGFSSVYHITGGWYCMVLLAVSVHLSVCLSVCNAHDVMKMYY